MKKMKNFMALLLALVMTMSLVACGNKTSEETKTGEEIGCYVQTTETGEKVLVDKDGKAVTDFTLDADGNVLDADGNVVVKAEDITAYVEQSGNVTDEKAEEPKVDDAQKTEDKTDAKDEVKANDKKTETKVDESKKDEQKPADNKQDTSKTDTKTGTKTDNKTAEKFSAYALNTIPGEAKSEEVVLYGVEPDSKYIKADLGDGVYISTAYADKYQVEPGDKITLKEKYERKRYTFKVKGVYDYSGAISVFMSRDKLNETFDLGSDYYTGYFANTKIKDIDEKYIGSVVDLEALTKVSRQLDVSMGNMMGLVNGFAIMIYMIVIYLLSKIIIEKNAQSISMTKILGYTNGEISRLYIMSTMVVVVIELLLSLPIETVVMNVIFRVMMMESLTGWITLWIDPKIYVEMFLTGFITYGVVALLEYRKIKKVPMDEALKNVE